jgi:hypothetical protein
MFGANYMIGALAEFFFNLEIAKVMARSSSGDLVIFFPPVSSMKGSFSKR